MRLVSMQIFDDTISTTSATFTTPKELYTVLGAADNFGLQAVVTGVSSPSPTLTVQAEHSADGQNWLAVAAAEISTTLAENTAYFGWRDGLLPLLLSHLRFKITLTGTSPECRLKLFFCGRVRSGVKG